MAKRYQLVGRGGIISPLVARYMLLLGAVILFALQAWQTTSHGSYLVYEPGEHVGIFMLFIAVPLLAIAFWRFLRLSEERFINLRLRHILLGAVLLCVPFFFFPPLLSRDVYYSLYYGQTLVNGGNPYTTIISQHFLEPFSRLNDPGFYHLPFPYGPIWGFISSLPIRLFGASAVADVACIRVLLLGCLLGSIVVIWKLASRSPGWRAKATVLFAWNPLLIIFTVNEAHNDIVMIFVLGLAMYFLLRYSFIRAFVCLLLGGLVKWTPLLFLPLVLAVLLRERQKRQIVQHLVIFGGVSLLVFSAVFFPFWAGPEIFRGIIRQATLLNFTPFIGQGAFFLGDGHAVASAIRAGLPQFPFFNIVLLKIVGLFLFGALFANILIRLRRGHLDASGAGYIVLLLFLTLVISWVMPWYILWFFPFAASSRPLMRLTANMTILFLAALYLSFFAAIPVLLFIGFFGTFFHMNSPFLRNIFFFRRAASQP